MIPLVSIAMTTYNGSEFLEKQLNSIINQSHKNIEIIICDDNSSDNTVEIIKTFLEKYSFIKFYKNDQRIGYAKNFEKAITFCSAEYIALSDQDDVWHEDKLEIQLKKIKEVEGKNKNTPALVHSDLEMIDDRDNMFNNSYFKFRKYKLKKEKDLGHIIGPCGVMGNTLMFNKVLKEKILPFPEYVENHDYWISLINELYGKRITLKQPLVKYRIHGLNVSNNVENLTCNNFFNTFKYLYTRNIPIPYANSKRYYLIGYILKNFDKIEKKDKLLLENFMEYLHKDTPKLKKISNALKYSFFKRDLIYRVKFIIGIIISK